MRFVQHNYANVALCDVYVTKTDKKPDKIVKNWLKSWWNTCQNGHEGIKLNKHDPYLLLRRVSHFLRLLVTSIFVCCNKIKY